MKLDRLPLIEKGDLASEIQEKLGLFLKPKILKQMSLNSGRDDQSICTTTSRGTYATNTTSNYGRRGSCVLRSTEVEPIDENLLYSPNHQPIGRGAYFGGNFFESPAAILERKASMSAFNRNASFQQISPRFARRGSNALMHPHFASSPNHPNFANSQQNLNPQNLNGSYDYLSMNRHSRHLEDVTESPELTRKDSLQMINHPRKNHTSQINGISNLTFHIESDSNPSNQTSKSNSRNCIHQNSDDKFVSSSHPESISKFTKNDSSSVTSCSLDTLKNINWSAEVTFPVPAGFEDTTPGNSGSRSDSDINLGPPSSASTPIITTPKLRVTSG